MRLPRLLLRRRRSGPDRRYAARLRAAFARERETGGRLLAAARAAAALIIAAWLIVSRPQLDVVYYLALLATFAGLPLGLMWLSRRGRRKPWTKYALSALDAALLTAALVLPNPLAAEPPGPPALTFHFGNFPYYFVLLAPTVLSLSPGYVLWTGFVGAAAWAGGVAWVLAQPHTKALPDPAAFIALPPAERIARLLDPEFVDLTARYQEVVLLLAVTAVLAIAVARSRRLVRRQAAAERERGNLARYFSPNVVDALARLDDPLGKVRRQRVAVMFADIVGFSGFAEHAAPEEVIRLLREHYDRLAEVVFAHGGTLDKYIGDALMATFGTPEPGTDDAARALACARSMIRSLDDWNAERARRGEMPVRMGIGIHYGAVVLGNVGSERRLEFTVIGDAVNIACRLEALTRDRGARLIVSERLVEAVREELGAGPAGALLDGLVQGGSMPLRGRDGEVRIWTLGESDSAVAEAVETRTEELPMAAD
ncbi:MAG TPA: adenylate/guanylate cyclase domain-containing protein [Stellaceae bacterium]|jgi:adenylate cyclase